MAIDVRYRNFFIPRPLGGKLFLSAGSFLEVFSTLGMKKFLYPTSGSFGNPLFHTPFTLFKEFPITEEICQQDAWKVDFLSYRKIELEEALCKKLKSSSFEK